LEAKTNLLRLSATTLVLCAPVYFALVRNLLAGSSSVTFTVVVLLHAAVLLLNRVRIRFDASGLERTGPLGGVRKLPWSEVAAIRALPTGVYLFDCSRRSVDVWNRFLDGYPELATEILARVSPSVLDASGDARGILEPQAALARRDDGTMAER
jgi:hypothetical protein